MKILRVISSMNPIIGGPSQGIRNSIPEMKILGIENEVVCLDNINKDYGIKDNFIIHKLGRSKNPWAYQKDLIKWLLFNFVRFDVVIIHGMWLYNGYATMAALKKYRKKNKNSPKVFLMPHGMLDPYFQKSKGRRKKAIRNKIYWRLIENNVVNNTDGILFTCEEELLLARETFSNYKPKREINVGYGIQVPPLFSKEMSIKFKEKAPEWDGKPFYLFLSRIHPKKGVDLIIKSYLRLEKEFDIIPQLIFAGPGLETSYGKDMLEFSKASKKIYFPGMLNGDAKWGAFYNAEAFVLPSHQENFGIAVVEALATGTPVLISNKVNIWREIKNGNGGFIGEDNEKETFKIIKKWFLLSTEEKQKMNIKAKEVYSDSFTIEKATLQFIRQIEAI